MKPQPTPASKLHLAAAFLAIYLIWGSSYLAIRIALEGFPPFLLAALRFSLAGGILFLIGRLIGAPPPARREWKASAYLGVLLFVGSYGALFWSEKLLSSSLAAVIYATMQLWVVALQIFWYRARTLDRKTLLGSLAGIAGVALICFRGSSPKLSNPVGIALVLLAAVLWAIGALWTPRLPLPDSKTMSASTQMLTGGILLFVPSFCSGEFHHLHRTALTLRALGALAYLIIFASLIAFTSYVWLLKRVPVHKITSYCYVNPIIALFIGHYLAHDPLTPRILLGSALVLASVFTVLSHKDRPPDPAPQQTDTASPADLSPLSCAPNKPATPYNPAHLRAL